MDEARLARLERLAFLPPGPCTLPLAPGGGLDCSTSRALLVDRYEVTWSEWDPFREAEGLPEPPAGALAARDPRRPAVWLDLDAAQRFAAAEGMRLPTAREWLRVAAGTRAQRWPWSSQDAESVTNTLELGLARTTDAGTFSMGATPSGVHDLLGNAREWAVGDLGPLQDRRDWPWAMGGSYLEHKRPIYQLGRNEGLLVSGEQVHREQRSIDLGLRLVADAEDYLSALGDAAPTAEQRERLAAVGARWGVAARPMLSELAARDGAPPALDALLQGARP